MNTQTSKFNREFAKIKIAVFKRDGFNCKGQYIKHFGPLTVDHIRKRSLRGKNELTNLITLCSGCHSIYEQMPNKDKEHRLKVRLNILYGYEL